MHGKNLPKVVPKGTICLSVLTNSILLFCTVLTNKLITMNSTGETHSVKLRHVPKEAKETAKSNDDESDTDLDF
jgi:hypothetical protein